MGAMIENYINSPLCGQRPRKLFTLHSPNEVRLYEYALECL